MKHFRNTVLVGLVLVIPVGLAILGVAKVAEFLHAVANLFAGAFLPQRFIGVLVVDIIVALFFVLLCYLAGLLAGKAWGKKLQGTAEALIIRFFPGFGLVKTYLNSLREGEDWGEKYLPVVVRFDDYEQLAFEMHRTGGDQVLVYLPGAPTPWSGSVVQVSADRVARSPLHFREAVLAIQQLGGQSADTMHAKIKDESPPHSASSSNQSQDQPG